MKRARGPAVRHRHTRGARRAVTTLVVVALACTVTPWVVASSSATTSDKTLASVDASVDASTDAVARGLRAFDVRWRRVTAGFSAPTQVTSAPDGRKRLFVVQKG